MNFSVESYNEIGSCSVESQRVYFVCNRTKEVLIYAIVEHFQHLTAEGSTSLGTTRFKHEHSHFLSDITLSLWQLSYFENNTVIFITKDSCWNYTDSLIICFKKRDT